MATKNKSPVWSDVKAKLFDFDRAALLTLVQALYGASKDNQIFLHSRFGLGEDVLKPYKLTIERWIWPDVFKRQDGSVAKAKKAISDYKKAIGLPLGLMELMVFYCERAADFSHEYGLDDEGYLEALVGMFEQALKTSQTVPNDERGQFITRLQSVRVIGHDLAYGVGDDMADLLESFGFE